MSTATFADLVHGVRRHRVTECNVAVLRSVDSTNALARRVRAELAEDDLPLPWSALLAFEQTAGRGRRGRTWVSPAGLGIYATVFGRLRQRERLAVLPLAVAAALAEALAPFAPTVRLKWPNDLMLEGRKVGGVLVESMPGASGDMDALIGFGINHGHPEAALPAVTATSLAAEGFTPALPDLACALLAAVGAELTSSEPVERTVERWLARTQHRSGDVLRCRVPEGEVTGGYLGLTEGGLLRLNVGGHERHLASGEVEA